MESPSPALASQDGTAALLGDGRTLSDLLRMAGPDIAPALLRQMQADLAEVRATLAPAITTQDWTALRAGSHVLISLAGTIGAMRLHGLAIDLNMAAHDRDAARLSRIAPPLMADLVALGACLRNHPEAPA